MKYKTFVINLVDLGGGPEDTGRQYGLINNILGFNSDYTFLALFEVYDTTYNHIKNKAAIEGYSIMRHNDIVFLSRKPVLGKHYKDIDHLKSLTLVKVKLENINIHLLHTTGVITKSLELEESIRGRKNTLLIINSSDLYITNKMKLRHDSANGIAVIHGNHKFIDNFSIAMLEDFIDHKAVSFDLYINEESMDISTDIGIPRVPTISDFDDIPTIARRRSSSWFGSEPFKHKNHLDQPGTRRSFNFTASKHDDELLFVHKLHTEESISKDKKESKERTRRKLSFRNILGFWKGKS